MVLWNYNLQERLGRSGPAGKLRLFCARAKHAVPGCQHSPSWWAWWGWGWRGTFYLTINIIFFIKQSNWSSRCEYKLATHTVGEDFPTTSPSRPGPQVPWAISFLVFRYFFLPKIQNENFHIPGDIPKELPVEVHSSGITGKPLLLGTCTGSKAKYQYILFASLQLLKNEDYLIYIVLALLLHCWLVWSWKCEDEGFKSLKSNNETFID